MTASSTPRLLYASFDEVPSPKGASTHIEAFAEAIGRRYGSLVLVTPGPVDLPARPFAPGVRQVVLGCPDDDLLGRVLTFRVKLLALCRSQAFDLIHFRSIFEGYALARRKDLHGARLLYEVNGFPSVELKYGYPRVAEDDTLQAKLVHQEQTCLDAADQVVTVSWLSQEFIVGRGIAPGKVQVLPNGVDPALFPYADPPVPDAGPLRLVYLGTLSAWQGVEVLLTALRGLNAVRPVHLQLVGPAPRARRAALENLVDHLGLEAHVTFSGPCRREAIAGRLQQAQAMVVPLLPVDRNLEQGCCPLKMLEAMAAGCPVVASDLPVVREIAEPGLHFVPAQPGQAASLAEAILRIGAEPDLGCRLARTAREHVVRHFRWDQVTERLLAVYDRLLSSPASSSASAHRSRAGE
jgi:glycosyltransferase involved in cell wall biosynthesis